ncbi:hypothetical protein [Actinokineospora sp. NBRC 105648]|uniref:hypothetical protein n=1 Tax=Actinokineospora sp. NBRC 105648 TaxID=3032206 RepID=UPI00249FD54D|nr:hypothetical protein [Actinokineospora sp. NBRC 105648]GLZ43598.1 hypothetical protein Acsp05_72220 [Actinokineospora sp. NBRC 105648]
MAWRYQVATQAPGRLGIGISLDAERFRATIDERCPNFDRIGSIGQLRADQAWDERSNTFSGGRTRQRTRSCFATVLSVSDAA